MLSTNGQNYITHTYLLRHKGKYVPLYLEGILRLLKVTGDDVIRLITIENTVVVNYIKFHHSCYEMSKNININNLKIYFDWYEKERRLKSAIQIASSNNYSIYNLVRCYMTISDLQSHFATFNDDMINQRYERSSAEKALFSSYKVGKWLLRHSSYNRPDNIETKNKMQFLGIRYYALSYTDKNIIICHKLICHRAGYGWRGDNVWFPCFLDLLEHLLCKYRLTFDERISEYISLQNSRSKNIPVDVKK